MKHTIYITVILLSLFFFAQIFGIYTSSVYKPTTQSKLNETTGIVENKTIYNLPYGLGPPENANKGLSFLWQIIAAITIAVLLILFLMKLKAEIFLRWWFFIVVIIGLSIALNAVFTGFKYSSIISLLIALPIAYLKVFRRNLIVHNLSEILIYPGIAIIFIPLLNVLGIIILLILISIYDIYAVWHAGFMQKMARYQIEKVKVFSGFFVPYITKKARSIIREAKKKGKNTKIRAHLAILGGGDVVFSDYIFRNSFTFNWFDSSNINIDWCNLSFNNFIHYVKEREILSGNAFHYCWMFNRFCI